MNPESMTNDELVRHVDNMPQATPLERLLAERLDELIVEAVEIEEENARYNAHVAA